MKHNEIHFRSQADRQNEIRLEDNYRQLGNAAILAAASYCGGKRVAQSHAALPQFQNAGK
ncbi:hypothetical protein DYI37_01760 [Fulvimarina endophytica]|uniref:Uncharacterized protein n=1 Tax=Fulvimarina endophytica TaxID=2293836 RepID=A0A371XAZ2_9HYPH|nr:hypothetical protein [Fulvimarina endophytica]RFC66214.1 hypothetical protein DYI37_01760 [Fulvimarina endophytica]